MRTQRNDGTTDPKVDHHFIGGRLVPVTPHAADSRPKARSPKRDRPGKKTKGVEAQKPGE